MSTRKVIMDLVRLHKDLQRIQENTEDSVNRLLYQAIAAQISDAVAGLSKPQKESTPEEEELEVGAHDIKVIGFNGEEL